MKKLKFTVSASLIAMTFGFGLPARSMDATDVQLIHHGEGKSWYLQNNDPNSIDGLLIASSESVVDQLDALDVKASSYHCQMKYRPAMILNGPGYQTIMVYGLTGCHQ